MADENKPKSAIERLEQLEVQIANVEKILGSYNQELSQLSSNQGLFTQKVIEIANTMKSLTAGVEAMNDLLLEKNVLTEIEVRGKIQVNSDKIRRGYEEKLITEGLVQDIALVEPNSFLAISQTGKEGLEVMRDHIDLSPLTPELSSQFVGRAIGDSVDIGGGISINILRIMRPVVPAQTSPAGA